MILILLLEVPLPRKIVPLKLPSYREWNIKSAYKKNENRTWIRKRVHQTILCHAIVIKLLTLLYYKNVYLKLQYVVIACDKMTLKDVD